MEIEKKIAGVNFDEWIDTEGKKDVEKIIKNKKYSSWLIAFLDILGVKDLIYKHRNGDEHIAIDIIENMRKIVKDVMSSLDIKYKFEYLSISDSFVFICEPQIVSDFVINLARIQMLILLECKQLLRGAITIGDAIMDEEGKHVMGPAYIRAFLLQENDSIYPRIIIDNCVKREILKIQKKENFISFDTDKECFLDYLKIFMNDTKREVLDIKVLLRREGVLEYLKEYYNKYDEENEEKHNIKQKYGWTIEYFKRLGVWENGK